MISDRSDQNVEFLIFYRITFTDQFIDMSTYFGPEVSSIFLEDLIFGDDTCPSRKIERSKLIHDYRHEIKVTINDDRF